MLHKYPQGRSANFPALLENRPVVGKIGRFHISQADFARAAQRQRQNMAKYLNPLVVAILMTLVFGSWVFYRWAWQPDWFGRLPLNLVEAFDLFEFGSTMTLLVLWSIVAWQRHQKQLAPQVSVDILYALSPYDFEHFVGQVFRRKGYDVTLRGRSGDMGVDLEIRKRSDNKKAVVQCKRYRNTVGPETIRELYGTMLHERVAHGFLVTTASISKAGREWAKNKPLTLIDGATLVRISADLNLSPHK
ncbi:MAG TPA: restriction endonuclease [Anaerolineae bacterium]|nr:restriction endonuclease [Anaerolineae bacterium]